MGYMPKTVSEKYQRPTILRESMGRCAVCRDYMGLVVHHLDGDRVNNRNTNLVCLCRTCHSQVHTGKIDLNDYADIKRKL